MRSDDALATILLVSRLASEGTRPLKASEYWRLLDEVGEPGGLLGMTATQLTGDRGLDPEFAERVAGLLDRATSLAFELERLDQSGIATLTPLDDDYPRRWRERLGASAPPVVHAAGEPNLLRTPAVGIVSSRDDALAEAEDVARQVGSEAATLGFVLATGGGDGADRAAAAAALDVGGGTVGILADPLLRTVRRPEVRRAIHAGTTLLCTPYAPDAPFSTQRAAGRIKLIHAQSQLTVVLEDEPSVWRGPDDGPIGSLDQLADLLAPPTRSPAEPAVDTAVTAAPYRRSNR